MKAVIFAGGVGTRLWPLSRKESPKQFAKIVGEKSTLQLAVERLFPDFQPESIYVATGRQYLDRTHEMLSVIPHKNIIGEPAKRDNGAAVGLMASYLAKKAPDEPVIILWSDHLVKHVDTFTHIIRTSGEILKKDPNKMIFIGQKPRFASENLGWIETGETVETVNNVSFRSFVGFKYRPDDATARKYFESSRYCWNLGYFVTTPRFLNSLFEQYAPDIHKITEAITETIDDDAFYTRLKELYPNLPEINFDKAVLEKIKPEMAHVVIDDIGWSDIGAWEALKEALSHRKTDNVTTGRVELRDSQDNLVYNYEDKTVVFGIDLHDMVVINTPDVVLVANKSSISKVKELVESLKDSEFEKLT